MYEAFYGFKEKPFSMLPDPGFLFLSKKHQAALTLLEYGLLNHVGFCVISGEPGAGKTTILRAMLERVGEDTTVGLITNTHQSFGGLLDWILSAFNLHRAELTHVEMHQVFMEFLIEEYANNRTVLLIVDEAQNMNADSLEELRMLSNVNSEKDQLLQVVLSGQPALKDMLRQPEMMQFAQRIAVDYHLDSLNVQETCGYIQHRLVTAGAEKDVFTPAACERIYSLSGGTPRLINLLCETVLVYGFADQQEMIDVGLVDEMVHERMRDSVVPLVNRDIVNQDNTAASKILEKDFPWIQAPGLQPPAIQSSGNQPQAEKEAPEPEIEPEPVEKILQEVAANVEQPSSEALSENVEKPDVAQEKKPESKPEKNPEVESRQKAGAVSEKSVASEPEITGMPLSASGKAAARSSGKTSGKTSAKVSRVAPVAEKKTGNETRTQLIKYGAIAVFFGLVLIVFAVVLDDDTGEEQSQASPQARALTDTGAEDEKSEVERDAALVRQEEQRTAEKQAAEKLAAEKLAAEKETQEIAEQAAAAKQLEKDKAAIAAKAKLEKQAAQDKLLRDEKRRKAIEKEKAREAKYAAERERRKMAKLEEERLLKEKEEARRLQQEWLESEREAQAKKP